MKNMGLTIFKKGQRLGFQRGTEELEPGPLPPEKRRIGPKEAAGLYDPGLGTPQPDQEHDEEWRRNAARAGVTSTIGINIGGEEWEVSTDIPNLEESDMKWITSGLPPDQWPVGLTDRIENFARELLEEGINPLTGYSIDDPRNPPRNHAKGTSNVGLLFYRKQLHKKTKL